MAGLVARLVAVVDRSFSIAQFAAVTERLEARYGPGVTVTSTGGVLSFRTPGARCSCAACTEEDAATYTWLLDADRIVVLPVCEACGRRGCPRLTHPEEPCSTA